MRRIKIRVVGFNDAERHAFNTLCRLSLDKNSGREWGYEAWNEATALGQPPGLTLIDGAHLQASDVLDDLQNATERHPFIWIGSISPSRAWASFPRPIKWPEVLSSMDDYFLPASQREEYDLELVSTTVPGDLEEPGAGGFGVPASQEVLDSHLSSVWLETTSGKARKVVKALVVDPSTDGRMVARSMLSALGIGHVEEAASCAVATRLLETNTYDVLMVDIATSDADPWTVIAKGEKAKRRIITGDSISLATRMAARVNGCYAMAKPLHSARLAEVMRRK
jgi:CheY-like chemotaxis protein